MTFLGIAAASVYHPRFGLDSSLASVVRAPADVRLAAPDEDGLTMAWEATCHLDTSALASCGRLVLAAPHDGLEPRAWSAHLHAVRTLPSPLPVLSVNTAADAADILAMAAGSSDGTLTVLVDRDRPADPLRTPTGDCAVALVSGEPRIAEVRGYRCLPTLSFDRWTESDERMDRDARFIEERVVAREGAQVVSELLAEAGPAGERLVGVVATVPAALKPSRLAKRWNVPTVVIPSPAATDPGNGRAEAVATALAMLHEHGPGSTVILLTIGWGASGIILVAGPDIGTVSFRAQPLTSTQAYNYRTWTLSHRPPYTANPWTSGSELTREAGDLLGLTASQCSACSAMEFPPSKVCQQCGGWDTTPVSLTPRGTVVTHSIDELYGSPDTTVQMVAVSLERGGRFYGQAAQGIEPWFAVDDTCRLVLRRLHTGSGLPHYFWKVDRDA